MSNDLWRNFKFEELPASIQAVVEPLRRLEIIKDEPRNLWDRRAQVRNDVPPTVRWGEQDFLKLESGIDFDRAPVELEKRLWTGVPRWVEGWQPTLSDLRPGGGVEGITPSMTLAYNPLKFVSASAFPLNNSFWLVTEELKNFLARTSPNEFAFIDAPFLSDGGERGRCFLMDVRVRRDVIDLERSRMSWRRIYETDLYAPIVQVAFRVLREDIPADVQAFRMDVEPRYICMRRELIEQANALGAMWEGQEFGFPDNQFPD